MPFLLLLVFVASLGAYNYFFKRVQQDHIRLVSQSLFFVAVNSLFQLVFLLVLPPWQTLSFTAETWLIGAGHVVFYTAGAVMLLKALSLGSMSLTHIIMIIRSFIPILAGLVLWNEKITWNSALGIVLFVGAVWLINSSVGTENNRKGQPKWLFYSISAGVFYGVAMSFSKVHGLVRPEAPKEYLMAFNAILVVLAVPYVITQRKKINLPSLRNWRFAGTTAMAAFTQGVINIIFMIYIAQFSSAVFFPMTAILSVLTSTAVGRFCFRDQIGRRGYAGVALSIAALVLLNL